MAASQVLRKVRDTLVGTVGYDPAWVAYDYAFADYLTTHGKTDVRYAPLAAFGDGVRSYRSACIGVFEADAAANENQLVQQAKSLGAPRIVVLGRDDAAVWDLAKPNAPAKLGTFVAQDLPNVISRASREWAAEELLRSKFGAEPSPIQLDLADLGLIPYLDAEISTKLHHLILSAISACTDAIPSLSSGQAFQGLLQTLLELLTAKLLIDRDHPSAIKVHGAFDAVKLARRHYGLTKKSAMTDVPLEAIKIGWDYVTSGFFFQNLSVHTLAYIYENTLVSDELRERLGVHGTPMQLAELAVSLVPLEMLPPNRDRIIEPFVGYGPFLLSALEALQLMKQGLNSEQRHDYLVQKLQGIDTDSFAIAVCRLCLTLADYPNPNGWNLARADVFASGLIAEILPEAGAVFSNPPFEAFIKDGLQFEPMFPSHQPAEFVWQVLNNDPPPFLAIVMPRTIMDSDKKAYVALRKMLARTYCEIDLISLSDSAFEHSDADTLLMVARHREPHAFVSLRAADVRVEQARLHPFWREDQRVLTEVQKDGDLWVYELKEVWKELIANPRLSEVAEVHRGIEYRKGSAPSGQVTQGVAGADSLRPYRIDYLTELDMAREVMRTGASWPYDAPKLLLNAARRSRGAWSLACAMDQAGLPFDQRIVGVWFKEDCNWPIEVLCAILNGPVANAWVSTRSNKVDVNLRTIRSVPLPLRRRMDVDKIVSMVRLAARSHDPTLIVHIDAEVLRGYDLPPTLEFELLQYFDGARRVGVPEFERYYPADFESTLPLHVALEVLKPENRFTELAKRLPMFDDPEITAAFQSAIDGFSSEPSD